MLPSGAVAVLVLLSVSPSLANGQQASADNERSPYQGAPVAHPELLSGIWETSNGKGGAVGIHLRLMTTIPNDTPADHAGQPSWQHLEVGVYERPGADLQIKDRSYFSDSLDGGGVRYEDGRLKLYFAPRSPGFPGIDLDLLQQQDGSWSGRFHRGAFDAVVNLRRPAVEGPDRLAGTWSYYGPAGRSCIHIVHQGPNAYEGWSDSLGRPIDMRYANGIQRPREVLQTYGELMRVDLQESRSVSLELSAYTGICCSRLFVGRLIGKDSAIEGRWQSDPARSFSVWKKIAGNTCMLR